MCIEHYSSAPRFCASYKADPEDEPEHPQSQPAARNAQEQPSWLLDSRLDVARVRVTQVVEAMWECENWNHEMEQVWRRIQKVETAHKGMAEALGLTKERRNAAASSAELTSKWKQLSDVLETNLQHLQKVGGAVLDEYLKKAPPTPKHGGDTDPPEPEAEEE